MIKVSRRGGFSDRQGIKAENTEIQLKDLDNRTRIQICNLISSEYQSLYTEYQYFEDTPQYFFGYIRSEVFCQQIDARKLIDDDVFFRELNEVIMTASYDDVLTLIEAIAE